MNRLILVSPHFPPTNAPDMQRVRQMLPHLGEMGWRASVIAVHPDQVAAPTDSFLEATIPDDVPIDRVRALSLGWKRLPGFGTLGWRCRRAVRQGLRRRLTEIPSDDNVVVYFSTTQFTVWEDIPQLKRDFPSVRFVVDYQDPWTSDFHRDHPDLPPPGGRLKYGVVQMLARLAEPHVLRHVSGITSVSASYLDRLLHLYPQSANTPRLVEPFSFSERDFETLNRFAVDQRFFSPGDGCSHWVYVGRGGPDMALACRGLFRALRRMRDREGAVPIKIHFIGTDYAPPDRAKPTIRPLAEMESVAEFVEEHPARIPYSLALRCLLDADAIIVPGSTDAAYTASKLYPCIAAAKPLLTLFHERSQVNRVLDETCAGVGIRFSDTAEIDGIADEVDRRWIVPRAFESPPITRWAAFTPYTARMMTHRLTTFFAGLT